jgi:hemerythrin-like domain-containing protein
MAATKTGFPGFDAPAAGFEAPLEMLSACHGRVERQCQTLLRLVPHLAAHGPDRAARDAAQNVLRYFDTAAKHHHADEEQDLFPALLHAVKQPELERLRALVDALNAQHRDLERYWNALRDKLEGVRLGTACALDADEVGHLVGTYRDHIEREERELLPLAARVLDVPQLDRIGRAMRKRRGIEEI